MIKGNALRTVGSLNYHPPPRINNFLLKVAIQKSKEVRITDLSFGQREKNLIFKWLLSGPLDSS